MYDTWIIKLCGPDDWEDCEPGWYWGGQPNFDPDDPTLGDTVGPFSTAAEAALDMALVLGWAANRGKRRTRYVSRTDKPIPDDVWAEYARDFGDHYS